MVTLTRRNRRPHHPMKRLGQRGQVLLLLGAIFIGVGFAFTFNSEEPGFKTAYAFPIHYAPMEFWGGVFVMAGLVAVVAAFWKTGRDVWGFGALVGWSALWGFAGFGTWVLYDVSRAIVTALVWLAIAGVVSIVSGMRGRDDD